MSSESTRIQEQKELDRIRHVDVTSAQTGPIFSCIPPGKQLSEIIRTIRASNPLYDFVSEDGVRHQLRKIDQPDRIETIRKIFSEIEHIYIADGHHRAASAVKVGLKRRAEHPGYDGTEEFNYFLSVLFPADELCIYDYNRVVDGLNSYTFDTLLEKLEDTFLIEKQAHSAVRLVKASWLCTEITTGIPSRSIPGFLPEIPWQI